MEVCPPAQSEYLDPDELLYTPPESGHRVWIGGQTGPQSHRLNTDWFYQFTLCSSEHSVDIRYQSSKDTVCWLNTAEQTKTYCAVKLTKN